MKAHFKPSWSVLNPMLPKFESKEIEEEPMFYHCDRKFVEKNAGLITKAFIKALDEVNMGDFVFLDSRSHMLMKDWYPAIPGYHLDDIPREDNGQPNVWNPKYISKHICVIVGDKDSGVAPTRFICTPLSMDLDPSDTIWRQADDIIVNRIKKKEGYGIKTMTIPNRKLVLFGMGDFHTAIPALESGWRYFARVSFNTELPVVNKIRKQTQVYIDPINKGW